MCFLCRFVLVLERAGLLISFTVQLAHRSRDVPAGGIAQAYTVGTHIGNMPVLVQLLSDQHGLCHAVTQLSRGFLLQGRGGKWRGRGTFSRFNANVGYLVFGADAAAKKRFCILCAVLLLTLGFEGYRFSGDIVGSKQAFDLEMTYGLKSVDLALSFGDKAYGDTLHAAGTQILIAGTDLAP